jgi:hypothetical protein
VLRPAGRKSNSSMSRILVDRFLLDKTDGASTDILRSRFTTIDREKWIPWSTPDLN